MLRRLGEPEQLGDRVRRLRESAELGMARDEERVIEDRRP
jgi:hypothetical protein